MAKLNVTRTTNVNVLGEGELAQVVGGYCHRRRYGYGKHCGGWRKREYHCEKSYEAPSYESSGSDEGASYEESYETTSADGTQIVNVAVTVNISQVQG